MYTVYTYVSSPHCATGAKEIYTFLAATNGLVFLSLCFSTTITLCLLCLVPFIGLQIGERFLFLRSPNTKHHHEVVGP